MKCRLALSLMLLPLLAWSAQAGIIFNKNKKAKQPPETDPVPQLINQVKSDGDEAKRAEAARELRQYDPGKYPYLVPILVDVLLTDKKPAVRAEAAQSLGKIRPISQQAGLALDHALAKDSSMRVRLQARSALMQYHWAGYHSTGLAKDDLLMQQSKEPPLAPPGGGSYPPPSASAPPSEAVSAPVSPLSPQPLPLPAQSATPMPVDTGVPVPPISTTPVQPRVLTPEPPLAPTPASAPAPRPAVPAGTSGGGDSGPELSPPG